MTPRWPRYSDSWKGLGYNRRALYLKQIAQIVVERHGGSLPDSIQELTRFPGIGTNTAAAILAFAFEKAVVFIETNVRSVFIHHFFADRESVRDVEILPLIEAALDRDNPRIWYWALMDYGAMLKEEGGNPSRRSAHHTRQSPFAGSDREIRGAILRLLLDTAGGSPNEGLTESALNRRLPMEPQRVKRNLANLVKEGFITRRGSHYRIR